MFIKLRASRIDLLLYAFSGEKGSITMLKYVFKRILAMIPVLFIISIVIFGTVKAMPGDEVTAYFGAGSKVTQEQRDHVRELKYTKVVLNEL